MARLPILTAPDPLLKRKAARVACVDASVRKLMDDMLETMYAAPGIGLAATQVGDLRRVIVLDVAQRDAEIAAAGAAPPAPIKRTPLMMANPEIVWVSDEDNTYEEGCLSVPEHYAEVVRPARCRVRYLDYDNQPREIAAEGVLATCLQHEIDHLDGILFIDHLSALKRNMILRKLLKERRDRDGGDDARP
jgi:peptide deformylase